MFGFFGQTDQELKNGRQEEAKSGEREGERPLEGDNLGAGGDFLDGVQLGQAGDEEEDDAFEGVIAGEEGEEPDWSGENGEGTDEDNGGGEGVAGQQGRGKVVVGGGQIEVEGVDDRLQDVSEEKKTGDEDEEVFLFHG